ncbi:MAG: TetR/AcrR family transcriptional regulator [Promethearchaeota archaeon]
MSPKVSEEHKTMVQEKILTAASSLFSKKGYHETSMDDIVKESGFSKGAIYGYFDSKEALFMELQKKFAAINYSELKSVVDKEKSAITKLERAADLVFSSICEVTEEACRMDLEFQLASSRIPKMRKELETMHMTIIRLLTDILDEGIESREFRKDLDSRSIAIILVSAIGGLSNLWITTGIKLEWDKIKTALITTVRNGILR